MKKTKEELREYKKLWRRKQLENNPELSKQEYQKNKDWHKKNYESKKEDKIAYQKQYYQENKEKVKEKSRKNHLKKKYNLSAEQYLELCNSQNNKCAICNKEESKKTSSGDIQPLCVDHNHITGEVRQLLCNDCNALLGFAKEDINVLNSAIKYLKIHG
jgi:hypothetical protein